ncbi:hypothetical protein ACFU44_24895 [Nocardia rhizosphaerihabitans]
MDTPTATSHRDTYNKTAGHLGDLVSITASDNLLAHQQVRVAEWQTR